MPQQSYRKRRYSHHGSRKQKRRIVIHRNVLPLPIHESDQYPDEDDGAKQPTIRKLNCHPRATGPSGTTSASHLTCYTPDIVRTLKHTFNARNPTDQIQIDDSRTDDVYAHLAQKLAGSSICHRKDERCMLKLLDDDPARQKQILDSSFAPHHPKSWNRDSDAWLSNFDISKVMRQYERVYPQFRFIDPSTIDFDKDVRPKSAQTRHKECVSNELCRIELLEYQRKNVNKLAMVFNTAKHDEDGEHWFSLFVDLQDAFIFYFDSSPAENMPNQIQVLVQKLKAQGLQLLPPVLFKVFTNLGNTHQHGTTECGMYSLFFIVTMLTGETDFKRNMTAHEKIELFKTFRVDDKYVHKLRKVYFNTPDASGSQTRSARRKSARRNKKLSSRQGGRIRRRRG